MKITQLQRHRRKLSFASIASTALLGLHLITSQVAIAASLPSYSVSTNLNNESIKGIVYDEKGEPLPGANVVIKGTNQGTQSDLQGIFALENVQRNATLVISFVGYVSQEYKVGSASNITIKLAPNSRELNEIVVTGYGSESKKSFTGIGC